MKFFMHTTYIFSNRKPMWIQFSLINVFRVDLHPGVISYDLQEKFWPPSPNPQSSKISLIMALWEIKTSVTRNLQTKILFRKTLPFNLNYFRVGPHLSKKMFLFA